VISPTKTLVIDLTDAQIDGLKTALRCRADASKETIDALVSTKSGRTALADHWRTELATAEQLLAIVQKAAQRDSNRPATSPSTNNPEQP
jgi:hypothetical protein